MIYNFLLPSKNPRELKNKINFFAEVQHNFSPRQIKKRSKNKYFSIYFIFRPQKWTLLNFNKFFLSTGTYLYDVWCIFVHMLNDPENCVTKKIGRLYYFITPPPPTTSPRRSWSTYTETSGGGDDGVVCQCTAHCTQHHHHLAVHKTQATGCDLS